MRMWVIHPNDPNSWNYELIKVKDGKRDITEFVEASIKKSYVSYHDISDNDESIKFIIEMLQLNETMMGNTMTLYEDKTNVIQYCYHQDYLQYYKVTDIMPHYNYFASIINNDIETIYGKAIFFQVNKDKASLVDLDGEKLFGLLANLHYVKAFQVRDGELVEITFPNIKGVIKSAMENKKCHMLQDWEFYRTDGDLSDLGITQVNINDYNGLIILKKKPQHEVTEKLISEGKLTLDENTLRGVYEDINYGYVSKFFL